MDDQLVCGFCGHVMILERCGHAAVGRMPLCHADDHDCYSRWTVYGERPEEGLISRVLAELSKRAQERVVAARDAAARRQAETVAASAWREALRTDAFIAANERYARFLESVTHESRLWRVGELHQPRQACMGIECHGCYDMPDEDYHDAWYPEWPCRTWLLIEAGET